LPNNWHVEEHFYAPAVWREIYKEKYLDEIIALLGFDEALTAS
jgi:hypothetical protein